MTLLVSLLGLTIDLRLAPAANGAAGAAGVRYVDEVFTGVTFTDGIVYGRAQGQRGPEDLVLDLYEPAGDVAALRPVIVYIHGGFFSPGIDRKYRDATTFATSMAKRGYVVVSIDYRVYAGPLIDLARLATAIPAALEDAQAAVRWLRVQSPARRLHPDAIAVAGYSAGAITALNVNYQPNHAGISGSPGYRQEVQAAISFAGIASQISPGAPPIQMSGGDLDILVPFASQQATCNATIAIGNACDFNTYPGTDHTSMGLEHMTSDLIPRAAVFLSTTIVPNLASIPRSVLTPPSPPLLGRFRELEGTKSAIQNTDGRLEVFGPSPAGIMQNVYQRPIGLGWSNAQPFPAPAGALTTKQIVAYINADGRLGAGLLGVDGRIYLTEQRPPFTGWFPLGAIGQPGLTFAAPPTFAKNPDYRLEAFAVSTSGQLMHSWQDRPNGDWSNWYDLDPGISYSTDPDGAVDVAPEGYGPGIDLVAVENGGTVRRTTQLWDYAVSPDVSLGGSLVAVNPHWAPFTGIATGARGRPALMFASVVNNWGSQVFFRDAQQHLRWVRLTGDGGPPLFESTTAVAHAPSVESNADLRHEVFMAGADGYLWHSYQTGYLEGWSPLFPMGMPCAQSPSAVRNDDGRLEVFCVGPDGTLWHDYQVAPNAAWYGPTSLAGIFAT